MVESWFAIGLLVTVLAGAPFLSFQFPTANSQPHKKLFQSWSDQHHSITS